jgi:hypothetical protein
MDQPIEGERTVGGTKSGVKNTGWRAWRLIAAMGAVVTLAAIEALGCGGGSNTSIFPFAGLWVANSGGPNVAHFTGAELNLSVSNVAPKTVLNSTLFISPQDLTFDKTGNMWIVDGGLGDGRGTGAAVYEFALAQLKNLNSQPSPSPAFIIVSTRAAPFTFMFPQFAVFDAGHNLWVSDSGSSQILKFSASQLATPTRVSITPAATLQGAAPGVFNAPLGMAFDKSGNLWIANNAATTNTIVEISAAVLAAASGPVNPVIPATILKNLAAGPLNIDNPWGMLFDSNGNLWFTNEQLDVSKCAGSVVEFSGTLIAAGGVLSPPPTVVLTQTAISGTESLCDPNGISMTSAVAPAALGNISVANAGNNSVAEYLANQITASGSPTPNLFITGGATTLRAPTGLSYGPLSLE